MNGAEHWKRAEEIAARAAKMTDLADMQAWTALGSLELDLARSADAVLLSYGSRDPEYTQPDEGWPPSRGDIWRDSDGNLWQYESTGRMVCLNNNANSSPDEVADRFGPMMLVYRVYTSLPNNFDDEPPF